LIVKFGTTCGGGLGMSRGRAGRIIGLLAALAAVAGAPAAAAPAPDQRQEALNTSSDVGVGGASEEKLAQVITSGVAGYLSQVDLVIGCASGTTVQLQVVGADTVPLSDVLATQDFSNVPPFPLDGPPPFVSFQLSTRLFMPAQTEFGLVIAATSGECGAITGPDGDTYSRGNLFADSRPNPAGVWGCACDFPGPWDLAFRTYVDPACVVPALRGQTVARATAQLQRYGCAVGKVKHARSKKKKGRVIAQNRPPGAALAARGRVSLVVSSGKTPRRTR
jgi:hypothetical protein